jgi:signal transduction histidine kinase
MPTGVDPLFQAYIVGVTVNAAAAAIALYLWTERRGERFLLFWALAWTSGLVRWLLHYPPRSNPTLQLAEALMISVTMLFTVLGSYDLLPTRPWRRRSVLSATVIVFLSYGVVAHSVDRPMELGYGLFATVMAFAGLCMGVAYGSTRLPGYAFGAATCLYELGMVGFLLLHRGGDVVANSVVVPLFNIPLVLSIVVIAYQRHRRMLIESEQTLLVTNAELRASGEEMRQLYVRLANVGDDERRALHRELHDQVGANLSALRLELDVAAGLLARDEAAKAQDHLGGARTVAAETMARARDLMAVLRPPALDDYGLVAALRTFAESQSARLDLPIDVDGDDLSPRPSQMLEGALFRIAQEAVINTARHASATRICIEVAERDDRIILTVEDDGVGFDASAPGSRPDHWGLRNMRERARAIGGTLRIETTPGSGTRIIADAPRGAT